MIDPPRIAKLLFEVNLFIFVTRKQKQWGKIKIKVRLILTDFEEWGKLELF